MSIKNVTKFHLAFQEYIDSDTFNALIYRLSTLSNRFPNTLQLDTFTELADATQNKNTNIAVYIQVLKIISTLHEAVVQKIGVDGIFAATGRLALPANLNLLLQASEPTELFLEWKKSRNEYAFDTSMTKALDHNLILPDDSVILDPRYEFDLAASGPRTDMYFTQEARIKVKSAIRI